ncbi:MAG: flagellar motor switch protein FliN [Acidobacteriia bacterium]|nr:flagellar motor switch protein FliN [Terriglobia bacterium]
MAQVLGQIAGAPLPVECALEAPPTAAPGNDGDLQFIVVSGGSLQGEMSLRLPRTAALAMAQLFLSEAQDAAAEFKPDHREALEELLRQIAGYATTALKPAWGEVQLRLESGTSPSWSPGASGWLTSAGGSACRVEVEWQLSSALHAALMACSPVAAPAEPQAEPPGTGPGGSQGIHQQNLGLLMDVHLDVLLRFGERRMVLREILELGAGSVVELDRKVEEPVDLLLDGRLVARGEVVIVDGNYGLRVLEVAAPPAAG